MSTNPEVHHRATHESATHELEPADPDIVDWDADDRDDELLTLLHIAAATLLRAAHEQADDPDYGGLTPNQLLLLLWLRGRHGARLAAIAEHLGVTRQSARQLVTVLERNRFVDREPDELEPRGVVIRLTEDGAEAVCAAITAIRRCMFAARMRAGHAQMDELPAVLRAIAVADQPLDTWVPRPTPVRAHW